MPIKSTTFTLISQNKYLRPIISVGGISDEFSRWNATPENLEEAEWAFHTVPLRCRLTIQEKNEIRLTIARQDCRKSIPSIPDGIFAAILWPA